MPARDCHRRQRRITCQILGLFIAKGRGRDELAVDGIERAAAMARGPRPWRFPPEAGVWSSPSGIDWECRITQDSSAAQPCRKMTTDSCPLAGRGGAAEMHGVFVRYAAAVM